MTTRQGVMPWVVAAAMVFAGLAPGANAQRADPEFLWVSPSAWAVNQKGLLRDLQAAADRGYRLVPLPSNGFLLLVQKSVDPSEPVEYIFAWRPKDMNEKAALGYRLVNAFVMVRTKGVTVPTYEYAEVATRLRQSMESELLVAAARGFRVVGLAVQPVVGLMSFLAGPDDAEFVATLERPVQATEAAHSEYIVLASQKVGTMQGELQAAANRGYRLLPLNGAWGATVLLEKTGDAEPIEYLALSAASTATMQAEMNKASASGYRFAATLGSGMREFVVVMQRTNGVRVRTHEQVLHAAARMETLKRELLAELEKGFRIVGLTGFAGFARNAETVAILERPVQ